MTLTDTAYRTCQEQELLERIAADPPAQRLRVLTPMKAIRAKCKWCMCDSAAEIRRCHLSNTCEIWVYRFGRKPREDEPRHPLGYRPMRAIRAFCIECKADSALDVRRCQMTECVLWPWRIGRRPSPVTQEAYETQDVELIQRSWDEKLADRPKNPRHVEWGRKWAAATPQTSRSAHPVKS